MMGQMKATNVPNVRPFAHLATPRNETVEDVLAEVEAGPFAGLCMIAGRADSTLLNMMRLGLDARDVRVAFRYWLRMMLAPHREARSARPELEAAASVVTGYAWRCYRAAMRGDYDHTLEARYGRVTGVGHRRGLSDD